MRRLFNDLFIPSRVLRKLVTTQPFPPPRSMYRHSTHVHLCHLGLFNSFQALRVPSRRKGFCTCSVDSSPLTLLVVEGAGQESRFIHVSGFGKFQAFSRVRCFGLSIVIMPYLKPLNPWILLMLWLSLGPGSSQLPKLHLSLFHKTV